MLLVLDYGRAQPSPVSPITTRSDDIDTMVIDTVDTTETASSSEHESGHQENVMPPSRKKKRLRITKKNPIYGFVEGARHGARKFGDSLHQCQICHT